MILIFIMNLLKVVYIFSFIPIESKNLKIYEYKIIRYKMDVFNQVITFYLLKDAIIGRKKLSINIFLIFL